MASIGQPTSSTPIKLRDRGPPSNSSLSTAPAQRSDDDLSHRNQTTGSELTIELLKEKTGLTDDQLDQPIPEYSLFDIASRIPNWSDYAGSQGMELSPGEKQSVCEDPSCTTTRTRAQRALKLWHGRDPYKATYRSLLNMCLKRKDGDVAIQIVHEVILVVKDTSKKETSRQKVTAFLEKYQLGEEFLDIEVSRRDLVKLSRCLDCWKMFARAADFHEAEVVAVERDGVDEVDRRYKALNKWQQKYSINGTYRALIESLLTIDRTDIVEDICKMQERSICNSTVAEGSQVVADDVPHKKLSPDGLKQQEESRHTAQDTESPPDAKSEDYVKEDKSYGAVILKRTFPNLPLSGLSEPEMKKLERRLFLESSNLSCKFHMLCCDLLMSLYNRHIPKEIVVACLMGLDTFQPVFESPNQPLFREQKVKLFESKDVAEIWNIISSYHSFFNYYLIEHISKVIGTDEDKQKMLLYKQAFADYAKCRVYECPAEFGSQTETDCHIIVKLDKSYDDCTLVQLDMFEEKLCDILQLSHNGVLRLCKVESGCYELTFQAPSFVQTAVFPLSAQQEAALKELGVLWICCGEYEYSPQPDEDADDSSGDEDDHPDDASQGTNLLEHMDAIYNRPSKKAPGSYSDSGVGRSSAVHSETKSIMTEFTEVFSLGNVDTELQLNETQQLKDEQPPMKNPVTSRLNVAAYNGNLLVVKNCIEVFRCDPLQLNKQGQTTLHVATDGGRLEVVKYLVENKGLNPAIKSSNGKTPVHIAAFNGHLHLVQYFIGEENVDPMCQDKQLNTPLHEACRNGDTEVVEYIISEAEKYEPLHTVIRDTAKLGSTMLHLAASSGYCPLVQFLMSKFSLSPNLPGHLCATPLHVASQEGHLNIVQYLASLKDCDVTCSVQKHVQNALHFAAGRGHIDTVKFLTIETKCDPTAKDSSGRTPLHLAALNGHLEIVQFFIDSKYVQADCVDNQGKTPLHCASHKGFFKVVKYLVEDCMCDVLCLTKKRQTPLHLAASQGHVEIVAYFTHEKCVDPLYSNFDIITPLHLAVTAGKLEVVKFYLDVLRCDLDTSDRLGEKLLFRAVYSGSSLVVKEIANRQRWTKRKKGFRQNQLLYLAVSQGQFQIVKFFILEKQWDFIPSVFDESMTLLHIAALNGHLDIVRFLITELKYSPDLPDHIRSTPLHRASQGGHIDVIKYLLEECKVNKLPLAIHRITPLHFAAIEGHCKVVELLTLKFGFDPLCTDSSGGTPLHHATEKGNLDVVEFFISKICIDPNINGKNGAAPLHLACKGGYEEIVRYLLEQPACNNMLLDSEQYPPLVYAVHFGQLHIVKLMILEKNLKDSDKDTLLQHAASTGQLEIVKFLVSELLLDPNIPGYKERTPLMAACGNGHVDVASYLLNDCKCRVTSDTDGLTLLHQAVIKGKLNMVKFLALQMQFDVTCRDKTGSAPLHYAALDRHLKIAVFLVHELKCDPNVRNNNGETPLHFAARSSELTNKSMKHLGNVTLTSFSRLEAFKFLVNKLNCDPTSSDMNGSTPLHYAVIYNELEIVKFLVSVLKKLNLEPNPRDKIGQTPVHYAARCGHLHAVEYFTLGNSYNPLYRDFLGKTPLHLAAQFGHFSIVKYFVSKLSINPDIRDKYGASPLHLVCRGIVDNTNVSQIHLGKDDNMPISNTDHSNRLDVVKFLTLKKKCDPFCKDAFGDSPLHLASKSANLRLVEFFVNKLKCDVNVSNDDRSTPLHLATLSGNLDIVKFLSSKKKCDLICRDGNGNTPLHFASQWGHFRVVEFFVNNLNCHPDIPNSDGMTPLHIASIEGRLDIVKLLCSNKKCDPLYRGLLDNTPLHYAVHQQHLDVVKFFVCELKPDLLTLGDYGCTCLHIAASNGDLKLWNFLVSQLCKAKIDSILGSSGATPLHVACGRGNIDVVKQILAEKASLCLLLDENNATPLHHAALSGHLHITKFLTLKKKCDPMCRDRYGNTPLHLAASKVHTDVVNFFIKELNCHQCYRSTPNDSGFIPYNIIMLKQRFVFTGLHHIHRAAHSGEIPAVMYLINEENNDPNCPDILGRTPLHYAVIGEQFKMVEALLRVNSNPMSEDVFHNLPVHYAAALGHISVAECLGDRGSPLWTRGALNMTPLDMATAGGHQKFINLLISNYYY